MHGQRGKLAREVAHPGVLTEVALTQQHTEQDLGALLWIGCHEHVPAKEIQERGRLGVDEAQHRRSRAAEDQGLHQVGTRKCQSLRDHSSHRDAVDVRSANPQSVQNCRRITGKEVDGQVTIRWIADPRTAVVEADRLKAVEKRQKREPAVAAQTESHDQQQRWSVAGNVVVNASAAIYQERHRSPPET